MRFRKYAVFLRFLAAIFAVAGALPSYAEVMLPMMSESSITLGSGIARGVEPEIKPGCFEFTTTRPDPNSIGRYSTRIYVVSSLEELIRERRKAGSASGSYGSVKAAVEGWSNTQQSEQQSALFVVIEANFTGPRTMMKIGKPEPDVAELIKAGDPLKIRQRCGTHIATVQHHGQVVRIVINMTSQDRLLKEAMQIKFAAKGSYGAFKAKASGSYSESLTKLAKSKQLEVRTEGTGQPPDSEAILRLLETKAGDLSAVAEQLGVILSTANAGKVESQAITGYTIQPLALFVPSMLTFTDTDDILKAENQLRDYLDMLSAQIASTNRRLAVGGMPESEKTALRNDLASDMKLRAALKVDLDACPTVTSGTEKACDSLGSVWYERLAATRESTAEISQPKASPVKMGDLSLASAELSVNSKFRGFAYLVATIDGTDYALDPVKVNRGRTQLNVFGKVNKMVVASPGFGPPPDFALSSDIPLTANLALLTVAAKKMPDPDFFKLIREVQLGCYGVVAYGVNPGHRISTFGAVQVTTTSKDSICTGVQSGMPSFGGPVAIPSLPGAPIVAVPDAIELMPFAVSPIRFDYSGTPISLNLVTIDEFGFRTVHQLAGDISTIAQEL